MAQVYAGAADKGRVYMVDTDGSVATAFDVDERSVSQVWFDHGLLGFATDDAAAMYRATGRASQAKYVSDVLDAKAVSRFGKLRGRRAARSSSRRAAATPRSPASAGANGRRRRRSRRSAAAATAARSRARRAATCSSASRSKHDARVHRVMTYYQPQNLPTDVQEVTVELGDERDHADAQRFGRQATQPGVRVKWKIENPDGDDTTYTLEARRDGEANWRPIATGKTPLTATTWEWNTETYPDGWYKVRVTSSDAAANSPDRALTSTATSTMFAIDNTRPAIDDLKIIYPRATARARDALSTIAEMAYSVDDGPWQLGTTSDGCSTIRPRICASTSRAGLPKRHAHARGPRRRLRRQRRFDVCDVHREIMIARYVALAIAACSQHATPELGDPVLEQRIGQLARSPAPAGDSTELTIAIALFERGHDDATLAAARGHLVAWAAAHGGLARMEISDMFGPEAYETAILDSDEAVTAVLAQFHDDAMLDAAVYFATRLRRKGSACSR